MRTLRTDVVWGTSPFWWTWREQDETGTYVLTFIGSHENGHWLTDKQMCDERDQEVPRTWEIM